MTADVPRLMLAAPASGTGKTTLTCAVLQALCSRGLKPAAFKCGPDYIDPMFHSEVIGAKSRNLDTFLCGEEAVRRLLLQNAAGCDVSVLEGVMGFYDGVGGTTPQAGSYDLARATSTPVVLVVNARGMSLSVAALVRGFRDFRADSGIKAVVLNECSAAVYPMLKCAIESEAGLPVLGFLPRVKECSLESRHLGLITAAEVVNLREKLLRLARQAEETLELDALLALAKAAPPLSCAPPEPLPRGERVRIALARDEAFCFYYEDSLALLRQLGAELVEFSPMRDAALPDGVCGLLLGGGYPEVHAAALAENAPLRTQLAEKIRAGLPTVAECGGFLYLHKTLTGTDDASHAMLGVLDGACADAGRLCRFGYTRLTARRDGFLLKAGESVPAHEFHRWDTTDNGDALLAEKSVTGKRWQCGHVGESLHAGFPHVHFCGNTTLAQRFLQRCRTYGKGEAKA